MAERIDDIVSDKAIASLDKLLQKLIQTQNALAQTVTNAGKLNAEIANSKGFSDFNNKVQSSNQALKEVEQAQNKVITATQKFVQAEKDLIAVTNQKVLSEQAEKKAVDGLSGSLEQNIRLQVRLKTELKQIQAEVKKLADSKTGVAKATDNYTRRVSALVLREAELKNAIQQNNAAIKQSITINNSAETSYDRMNARLLRIQNAYKGLSEEERRNVAVGGELLKSMTVLDSKIKMVDATMGKFQRNVGNYPKSFGVATMALRQFLGAFGLTSGIYLFANAIKNAIKLNIDFEKQMSKVKAVTGANDKEFSTLRKSAILLGEATKFTAIEVAGLQFEFAKLGFSTKEILQATRATLALAAATDSDLAKSAEIAGSTVRAFGYEADETNRVVDVLAASFNKSALSLDTYAEAIKYVAPIARVMNTGIEETSALLSVLADSGIKGSQAGTALRRIFNEISQDGRPFAERLSELAKSGLTLADAQDEVGRYAQTALIVLSKNNDKIKELTETYHNVNGEAERTADIMLNNVAGSIDKMNSAWDSLILSLNKSDGALKNAIDNITTLILLIKTGGGFIGKFADAFKYAFNIVMPLAAPMLKLMSYELDQQKIKLDAAAKSLEKFTEANNEFIKTSASGLLRDYGYDLEAINKALTDYEGLDPAQITQKTANAVEILAEVERLHNKQVREAAELEAARINALKKTTEETVRYLDALKRRKELELSVAEEIMNNENNSLKDRIDAQFEAERLRTDIAVIESNKRTIQAKGDAKAQAEIAKEHQENLKGIEQKGSIDRSNIAKQETLQRISNDQENIQRETDARIKWINDSIEKEKNIVKKRYTAGLIGKEQYDKELRDIDRLYYEWALDSAIGYLELELAERRKANDEVIALYEEGSDEQLAAKKKAADEEAKIINEIANLQQQKIDKGVEVTVGKYDELIVKLGKYFDAFLLFGNEINTIFDAFTQKQVQNIESQISAINDKKDAELAAIESTLLSEEEKDLRKKEIEASAKIRSDKLEKDKATAQTKAAQREKALAIFQAAMQSVPVILNALQTKPFVPAGIIAAALAAASVAKLVGTLAKPIPKFADGTLSSPEGMALVGERGTELRTNPDGSQELTPDRATLTYLKRGTKITPNHDLKKMAVNASTQLNGDGGFDYSRLQLFNEGVTKELRGIKSEIRNKKEFSVNGNISGFKQNGNRVKYIDSLRNR